MDKLEKKINTGWRYNANIVDWIDKYHAETKLPITKIVQGALENYINKIEATDRQIERRPPSPWETPKRTRVNKNWGYTESTVKWLKRYSEETGIPIAQIVQNALEDYIEKIDRV